LSLGWQRFSEVISETKLPKTYLIQLGRAFKSNEFQAITYRFSAVILARFAGAKYGRYRMVMVFWFAHRLPREHHYGSGAQLIRRGQSTSLDHGYAFSGSECGLCRANDA
jgi:hypothetical protein